MNRDLLAIVFAYMRYSQKSKWRLVSKKCHRIYHHYPYIISLGKREIASYLLDSYQKQSLESFKYCFQNSFLKGTLGKKRFETMRRIFLLSIREGHLEYLKIILHQYYLLDKIYYHFSRDEKRYALFKAIDDGYCEIVRLLLSIDDEYMMFALHNKTYGLNYYYEKLQIGVGLDVLLKCIYQDNFAMWLLLTGNEEIETEVQEHILFYIILASYRGATEILKYLLRDEYRDVKGWLTSHNSINHALVQASEQGHIEIVRILLVDNRIDPSFNNNDAIILAAKRGHLEIVKILLTDPRVDPSDGKNVIIWKTTYYPTSPDRRKIIKLLLRDKRIRDKLSWSDKMLAYMYAYRMMVYIGNGNGGE